jgi:protein phosphatase
MEKIHLPDGEVLVGDVLYHPQQKEFFVYEATWISDEIQNAVLQVFHDVSLWETTLQHLDHIRDLPIFPTVLHMDPEEHTILYTFPEATPFLEAEHLKGNVRHALRFLHTLALHLIPLQEKGLFLAGLSPNMVWVRDDQFPIILRLPPFSDPEHPHRGVAYEEGYVAPELLLGGDLNPRADVYLFGALLYRILWDHDPADYFSPTSRGPLKEIYRSPHPGIPQLLSRSLVLSRDRFPDLKQLAQYMAYLLHTEYLPLPRVEVGVWSSIGRNPRRNLNEDAYLYHIQTEQTHEHRGLHAWFLVADGMGGGEEGEVASRIAVEEASRFFHGLTPPPSPDQLKDMLVEINQRIFQENQHHPDRSMEEAMGTTLAGLLVQYPKLYAFHVGDTRIYHYRKGHLRLVTVDHSFAQEMVRRGEATPEEIRHHPMRHHLLYSLGPSPTLPREVLDIQVVDVRPGDWWILLTDGVWEHIEEEELSRWIDEGGSPQVLARRLVRTAVEREGSDNATALVVAFS